MERRTHAPAGFRARRGLNWFTVGLLYATFTCAVTTSFAGPGMREEFGFEAEQVAVGRLVSRPTAPAELVNDLICDRLEPRFDVAGRHRAILLNIAIGFRRSSPTSPHSRCCGCSTAICGSRRHSGMVKINAAGSAARRGVFAGIFGFDQSGQTMISLLAPVILNGFTFRTFAVVWVTGACCSPPIFVGLVAIWFYFISTPSPDRAGYVGTIQTM